MMVKEKRNAAITAKIKRYTQEHTATQDLAKEAIARATMTKYGRIHTDGSRSGGQPVLEHYDAGLLADFGGGDVNWWQDYIRAELQRAHDFYESQITSWNTRQPTQSDALRDLVAVLYCASGCSCCRDDDVWEKASNELAELFGVPRYEDGSGYDWYSVRDAALQE